jgi:hypothetical protein
VIVKERFLMLKEERGIASTIHVVQNWHIQLGRLLQAR